ncbi:MAG: M20/M25/M40 family metallo-hydrolase [Clostridia bacterium]|nr:M20/M25/M40 family metallo-hydrolase [Clostridia bacterium]
MMAVLSNKEISTPTVECLFTSSEETGLVGASKFDYSKIESKRMINLDSAEEDTVIIGCCGGVRTELSIPVTKENGNFKGIKITIGGLCGGHSGEDINRGRLNSHILMGVVIKRIMEKYPLKLAYICGGDKDNAIPRECEAIIVPHDDFENCLAFSSNMENILRNENVVTAKEDDGLFINIEKTVVDSCFNDEDTKKILRVLSVPNAILKFRTVPPTLPEKSRNLARVRTNESSVDICFSSRSYYDEGLNESLNELDSIAKEVGGSTYHHERYPGWASDKDSKLVVDYQNAFYKVAGKKPQPTLIHAGLECGLISGAIDDFVAISVGCNVHDLHTPKETMELDSMDRVYEAIIEMLK